MRFFGGCGLRGRATLDRSNFVEEGYAQGVPMGGDLKAAPAGKAPTLHWSAALKDADGANLDRIQIIKGWVDANGKTQEKVYDVAWSGGRKPGKDGKLPPVGNTVDVKEATYTNAIGAPALIRPSGRTRSSTRISMRSTTCACWRSLRRGGPRTTPSEKSNLPLLKDVPRHGSRSGLGPRRSGTRRNRPEAGKRGMGLSRPQGAWWEPGAYDDRGPPVVLKALWSR